MRKDDEVSLGKAGGFSEHKVMLCLNKDLYRAFVKLQADKDLGRSYAGLLPYVEGLYHLGYLSKEVYEKQFAKYSEPLGKSDDEVLKTPEEQQRNNFLKQKDAMFKGMIGQFGIHSDNGEWLLKFSREAEKYKDQFISAASLVRFMQG